MNIQLAIGITGKKRSGKDTVASFIEEYLQEHPMYEGRLVRRLAFADKVRAAMEALDPWICAGSHPALLSDVLSAYGGWEKAKGSMWGGELRRLLQRAGEEMGRKCLGERTWVNFISQEFFDMYGDQEAAIITDIRYENEADEIRTFERWSTFYSFIIKVDRPDTGADDYSAHPSEVGVNDVDADVLIVNRGTLEDLRNEVRDVMDEFMDALSRTW